MATLAQLPIILGLCFLGSFCGLLGGVILLWKEKWAMKLSHFFVSFAVGALLGSALFDLIPEAAELSKFAYLYVLVGIVVFSITERALVWHHHHHNHKSHDIHLEKKPSAYIPLLIIGDTVHNFIDGVIIAATFLFSAPLGLITTLAVFLHEMPQEIGDFSIMQHAKYPKNKIFWYNFASASATFVGALVIFFMSYAVQAKLYPLIAFAAGGFIYIAAADLMPELKHEAAGIKEIVTQSTIMIAGIVVMVALSMFFGV
jgi:zinc and cadmium transporter